MGFLTALWNGLKRVVSLVLPFGKERRWSRVGPAVRWALHVLVVVLVVVLLYLLNRWLRIDRLIPNPPWARDWWLPILFLLVYALAWIGWWLYKLLRAEETSYYPDIDEAWDQAVRTIGQAGIRLDDVPVYLVLGRPQGPDGVQREEKARRAEEILFQAGPPNLLVKQTPSSAAAPLHVYASRDAVYVTCAGASLLGRQAANLAGEIQTSAGAADSPDGEGEDKTLGPNNVVRAAVKKLLSMNARIARQGREATEEERAEMRRLERLDGPHVSVLRDAVTAADMSARLRHLCRLIVRDRQPYCPVNGILVLIPFAATDTDADAHETAEVCARDLETARSALMLDCPRFAMVCDLETMVGFREFVQRQKAEDRKRRVGQRFPLGAELRGQPLAEALGGSIHWLCNNVLRDWVYRLFRVEAPGREDVATVVAGNSRLYLLMSEMRERDRRLDHIVTHGFRASESGPLRFGGCYLAGTGSEPSQQAFVPGVFKRLDEAQACVAWTPEARAEDARCHRLANLGVAFLVGLGLVVLAAVGWMVFLRRP